MKSHDTARPTPSAFVHTKLVYSVDDLLELTPFGRDNLSTALTSGALQGFQQREGRGGGHKGRWRITPAAVDAWIAEGCPRFPARDSVRSAS